MFRKALITAFVLLCAVAGVVASAQATGSDKITICHAAGLEGTTQYVTLTLSENAVYGPGGHFNENGTPQAGHEQDYFGPCEGDGTTTEEPPPTTTDEQPPFDACPNIKGNQAEVPEGMFVDDEGNCRIPHTGPPVLPDPPLVKDKCKPGFHSWQGKCYPDDAQKQPDGSVIYGEQG